MIGGFTLAVLALLAVFVYWLNNGTVQGEQRLYRLHFERPVSGLLAGAKVFFNGLRVGEVRDIALDPRHPGRLNVTIRIKKDTPVRADTMVGVEYQGLTGVAAISLAGGKADAPVLKAEGGEPPLLPAGSANGNNWTWSANQVLTRLDEILADNEKPFHEIIDNLATFSAVLSRNKDRLDGILAGLEKMTGGAGKTTAIIYDLLPPQKFSPPLQKPSWRLVIVEPTVALALNTDKLQVRADKGETMALGTARWTDNLPNLLQEKIIQSFENAGYAAEVLRSIEGLDSDNRLLIDIRAFHLDTGRPQAEAVVEFVAKLLDANGKVLGARLFKSTTPAARTDAKSTATALGQAFARAARELIGWSVALLS